MMDVWHHIENMPPPKIPVRQLSDWGIEDGTDSSPTLVNSERFPDLVDPPLLKLQNDVFLKLKLEHSEQQFMDEWRYTIVTSRLLSGVPPGFKTVQKSMLQLPNGGSFRRTKLGMLCVTEKHYSLSHSLNRNRVVLVLRVLRKCRSLVVWKLALLYTYLALQTHKFADKVVKMSNLLILKRLLKMWQKMDLYRGQSKTVISCMHLDFLWLRSTVKELLPLCHSIELHNYCHVYQVSLMDIKEAASSDSPESHTTLRKLLLCVLMSMSGESSESSFLYCVCRFFNCSPERYSNFVVRFSQVHQQIRELCEREAMLVSVLQENCHRQYVTRDTPVELHPLEPLLQELKHVQSKILECQSANDIGFKTLGMDLHQLVNHYETLVSPHVTPKHRQRVSEYRKKGRAPSGITLDISVVGSEGESDTHSLKSYQGLTDCELQAKLTANLQRMGLRNRAASKGYMLKTKKSLELLSGPSSCANSTSSAESRETRGVLHQEASIPVLYELTNLMNREIE